MISFRICGEVQLAAEQRCVVAMLLFVLAAAGCVRPATVPVQSRPATESASTVRRVCVQMGVPTFQQPDSTTVIHQGGPLPARLGGGAYVQLTGKRRDDYVQVKTLSGSEVWIAQSQAGRAALCLADGAIMRVCGNDTQPQPVPVLADFAASHAKPVAHLERGSLVQHWGYFEQRGRWTFVETRGKVGFVRSNELCHENSAPPDAAATQRLQMIDAPAAPDCYQSERERSSAEIRRIVIHNSEVTLADTIALFRGCTADRPRSAHVAIDRDGKLYRLVEDRFSAFHTGGTEYSGGFNSISLGVEIIAGRGFPGMTAAQERSLLELIGYWSEKYHISLSGDVLENSTQMSGYHEVEYWQAPITIHRLVRADRRTDCPTFIWPDSMAGDEEFLRWRSARLGSGKPR